MNLFWLMLMLAGLGAVAFTAARHMAGSHGSAPHSRPVYHASLAAIAALLPACAFLIVWSIAWPVAVERMVMASLPEATQAQDASSLSLTRSTIANIAGQFAKLSPADQAGDPVAALAKAGISFDNPPEPWQVTAAQKQLTLEAMGQWISAGLCLLIAAAGAFLALRGQNAQRRARNIVEQVMYAGLVGASGIAILTTIGIIASVLFQSLHFFRMVPLANFFLGTVWDPRFAAAGDAGAQGQFGMLPLLWGTVFISLMAMVVAVPVGLFAAIYMSEYAGPRLRGFAKPMIETLAGIPTIVYGFFALSTFGPFLRDAGAAVGVAVSANSVLTAGMVMGIMIIPFISSLSDDIINAVPNALREGSYALGATQSETIRKVLLPAALPGIVGAVLLAVSRAVGETMIVVLAAGIAANLTLNPLEPVTTMTVKIVSQLTGDLEFNSPQTLVAFALGLTLFVITLGLNVIALIVVRRYREQYE